MKITEEQIKPRIEHLEKLTGWNLSLTTYGVEKWQNGCCKIIIGGKRSLREIYIHLNAYIRGFEDGLSFVKS